MNAAKYSTAIFEFLEVLENKTVAALLAAAIAYSPSIAVGVLAGYLGLHSSATWLKYSGF